MFTPISRGGGRRSSVSAPNTRRTFLDESRGRSTFLPKTAPTSKEKEPWLKNHPRSWPEVFFE